MNQQVLLVASSIQGNISAWDVHTGTALTSYKTNACAPNTLSLLGADYLIASQLGKPTIYAWTWHKDQVHQRSFPPEPISALAASPDGAYLAAGGASGAVHLWETSTGRLLRSWPCHYKKVTCLAFSEGGGELITAGEDTIVAVWLLAEVLDIDISIQSLTQPLHSWSDHTMPVTALAVGAGGLGAIIVSGSADRSIKIHSLGSGMLLQSIALSNHIRSIVLDPGEHAVYAGTAAGGIYEISLVDFEGGIPSHVHTLDQQQQLPSGISLFEGHTKAVTSLALTGDGCLLVSGSEDGTVRVWDVSSRQPVRTLDNAAKGPVSAVIVIDKPPFMGVGGGKKGPKRMQPLAVLSKYPPVAGSVKPWDGAFVILDGRGGAGSVEKYHRDFMDRVLMETKNSLEEEKVDDVLGMEVDVMVDNGGAQAELAAKLKAQSKQLQNELMNG